MTGFTVNAVVYMAIRPATGEDDSPPPLEVPTPNALAERTRVAVNRARVSHETRDAIYALIDGLAALERELYETRRQMALHQTGVHLARELVEIGVDGLRLQRAGELRDGQRVHLYLSLRVWNSERVLAISTRVRKTTQGVELQYETLRPEDHDAIVAFCFQEQGKERRRELDAASSP